MPGIDWAEFRRALGDIPAIDAPALVRQKSRDFYWYSPILKEQLKDKTADLVVAPRDEAQVVRTVRLCVERRIPITPRGGGTGNYGQAMPLYGGVVLELTALDRIRSLDRAVLRVETGKKLIDLEAETLPQGWELRFHPSTRRTATIGGFVAGGSTGVGAINWGVLRDRGSVLGLRLVTAEDEPRIVELRGDDVLKATHAYGTNGIITEVELPLAPAHPWADAIVAFHDAHRALRFADALAHADAIAKKLITYVAAPLATQYFRGLADAVPLGAHIVICMVGEPSLEPFALLAAEFDGAICYRKQGEELAGAVPLYEYTWNHTTLHALKVDRTITYLQTLYPPGQHVAKIEAMMARFGDEVPMHAEFVRLGGRIACFGLPLVRYTTPERLAEIIAIHEAEGCPVFNPHTFVLEDGGMKDVDEDQLAFKRHADPYGLLNPGKMRAWEERKSSWL